MKQTWSEIVENMRKVIDEKHSARESGLQTCRKIIQTCAKAIRHIHRHEMEPARELLNTAGELVKNAHTLLEPHPDLLYAGYVQDAEKEYVEGETFYNIVQLLPFPKPETLDVHHTSYLNGLAEAASEGRRWVLDALRKGKFEQAESILNVMEDIYVELITFDYPDALTGGLRRTCDALRAVLERTRSDFNLTLTQKELQLSLDKAIEILAKNDNSRN